LSQLIYVKINFKEAFMSTLFTLPLDDPSASLELVGGKGASLSRLAGAGFPVPAGYHITTNAYKQFIEENELQPQILGIIDQVDAADPGQLEEASREISSLFSQATIPPGVAGAIVQAYTDLEGLSPAVAVRSSATAEDLPEASFAGQQETYLNVSGPDAVLEATRNCWASLWTARAIGYRAKQAIPPGDVSLAVVVQLLIPAEAAGILFTANPIDGSRDQILINASWGLGEAVVGGLVTPDTITLDKSSGDILTREIAVKKIQTMRVNGGTKEIPVPENLSSLPALRDRQAVELAALGKEIEVLYEMPMDIEWALSDGQFAIVQARPITVLQPPVPKEWNLPDGAYAAMRNNIVELMIDPLSPLFKTMGLRAVNSSMGSLLSGFFGSQEVMPGQLIIAVNEYAYYNGSVKFGPMMKIIFDTPGILRRMFTGAVERWTQEGRPRYLEFVNGWEATDWRGLSSMELVSAIKQLTEAAIDAYGSLVSGVIPAAWISEALFTMIYRLVKGRGGPSAPTYLMGFDSLPIRAEKSLYGLSLWVREKEGLAAYVMAATGPELAARLQDRQPPQELDEGDWNAFLKRFQTHLQKFGHTIYNLDFANPVPSDDPIPVLETFKLFAAGGGINPYERQKATAKRREHATRLMQERLRGWRLNLFQKNLERAQRYAPMREDGLADVGLSYPLLREMLLELGRRFSEANLIEQAQDIFWLEEEEVVKAAQGLDDGIEPEKLVELVPQRRAIWKSANRAVPPIMLPQLKVFGFDLLKLKAGWAKKGDKETLKGVAASPGNVTAPASVLHGPEDFNKMQTGNVLVASITTPAWTPLFARAAAVVTDIGGPLSHGSIVAREYGIPAVLGTDSATKYIADGQLIKVDGDNGRVTLIQNE
jgi:phosphohistidine swiveling domain-containing protein